METSLASRLRRPDVVRPVLYALSVLVGAVLLLVVLGFGDLAGLLVGLSMTALWLAIVGVAFSLFYRLVLAVERIARALEE
jgi:hypothetical protein